MKKDQVDQKQIIPEAHSTSIKAGPRIPTITQLVLNLIQHNAKRLTLVEWTEKAYDYGKRVRRTIGRGIGWSKSERTAHHYIKSLLHVRTTTNNRAYVMEAN